MPQERNWLRALDGFLSFVYSEDRQPPDRARGGYNVESYGVPPDVWVASTPEGFLAGRDPQLAIAVEILQAELKRRGGEVLRAVRMVG
jgi:hypothetical protein